MNEISKGKTKSRSDPMGNEVKDCSDPFDWKMQQGVKFLSMVLWELGLDEEPEETLLEVLDSVVKQTGIHVLDLETARFIIDTDAEFDHVDNQNLMRVRVKRIAERQKRKLNQIEHMGIPF